MPDVGFRRLFWIGAAALLGVAALISIVALLRGEFTETDGRILATLGSVFLAGSTSLAGLMLIDRRDLVPLGWIAALGSIVAFVVLALEIWTLDGERGWLIAAVLLAGGLMSTTSRLLLRSPRHSWLYWCAVTATTVAVTLTSWAILAEPDDDAWAKAVGSVWILAVLGWFLVPVLGRTSATTRAECVVGRGPGRFEVELAAGETLVVRGR
jgi:hypothetical protein